MRKSGILNFNNSPQSNHRALFADFDEQSLFQGSTTDPTSPSQRLLRLNNSSQCKTYLKLVHAYFTAHKITERSYLLDSLQADAPASIICSLYDFIDRDITKGLLHAEQKSARAPYGSPWSPTLMKKGQELIFWKHCCSDSCRYGDALASIRDTTKLASRPNYSPLCQNRRTISFSLHCLQAAGFALDKCHLNPSHLRQEHLQERARLAAITSNVTA